MYGPSRRSRGLVNTVDGKDPVLFHKKLKYHFSSPLLGFKCPKDKQLLVASPVVARRAPLLSPTNVLCPGVH
jgi:hypothetical protein